MLLRKSFQYSQKYNKVLFKPSSAEEVEAKDLKKRNKKSPHQIPEKREGEKKPSPFSFLQQAKVDIKLEEETEEAIEQRFFAALKKESRKTQKVLEELKQRENKDKKQSKTEIRKTDLEKYIQEPIKSENKIESTEDDLGLWNNFCTVINYNSEYEIKDASFPYRDILFLSSDDEVDFKNEGLDRRTDRMTSQSIGLEEPVIETLTRKPTSNQSATRSEFFTVAVNSGGEIIKEALRNIHLPTEILSLRNLLVESPKTNLRPSNLSDTALLRRLRIFENFWSTSTEPTWLMLTLLPVLPPSLRPLIELPTGKLVVADVNEIYKLILMRNETLFHLIHKFRCPMVVKIFNQKLLQEAVDSLIDNARVRKSRVMTVNNQPLKSLSEVLEGKQGRFRQSLLGKRVDYSGRSVIVVNPTLRLNQCGLPYEMARELFEPFLVNQLLQTRIKPLGRNTRLATLIIRKNKPFVWSLLEKLTRERCILLNRAPTLHRFGIQAFDPLIVLGQAIHLHPLVCTGFNADFDGDQMAVHLPISDISQSEAKFMMRPSYNVLSPSNGEVILKPTQDMVIGCYYLTLMISKSRKISKKWFANETEAILAFYQKKLTLHTPILVRYFLSDFIIKIENSQFYLKSLFSYSTEYQKVIIYKKFKNKQKDYYFLTNLGIIIGKSFLSKEPKEPKEPGTYELTTFFFETTPGRLIFSTNLKDLVLHTQKREENEDKINLL
jgi:DNA-directed RNA polymerase beta' subunit